MEFNKGSIVFISVCSLVCVCVCSLVLILVCSLPSVLIGLEVCVVDGITILAVGDRHCSHAFLCGVSKHSIIFITLLYGA